MRVLIVDDDPATRDVLTRGFLEEGFRVEAVADGRAAEASASAGGFDAIVLDVMLPDYDGFAVCRRLRTRGSDTPILLLTGRQSLTDKVRGLDAGADDYLPKPFAFEELLARLRALTRRGRTRQQETVLSCGPIALDPRDRRVTVNAQPVVLTATEYRLLEYLLRRADSLVTRDELARHVWDGAISRQSGAIDVYVSYLRKKLTPAGPHVRTVRGVGYTLTRECA